MSNMQIQTAGFLDNSLCNGKGIRSVLFVSGCPHRCKGCHNPQTWNFDYGDSVSIDDLYTRILSNVPLIKGVTYSGGEPVCQSNNLIILSKKIKKLGLNIWCYTGYTFEELQQTHFNFLKDIDVLVDGKFEIDNKCDNSYKGSSNQRIIDVQKSLKVGKMVELGV